MSVKSKEELVKELHDLVGNAYCLFELSEEAFELWTKMIERELK